MALVSRPGSLATLSSLCLDFALRHLPRRRRAAPVTIVPSFVLSACNSHQNSGAAVTKPFPPALCLNSKIAQKVSRAESVLDYPVCRRLAQDLTALLGGRSLAVYCASNARSAAATVGPIPTMPFSTLGPSTAIQRSPRKNSWGRRTADGLLGRVAQ